MAQPNPQYSGSTTQLQCFKTRMCHFNLQQRCTRGSSCLFAHSADEVRSPPDLSKTKICVKWKHGTCRHGELCTYAHGLEELRPLAANAPQSHPSAPPMDSTYIPPRVVPSVISTAFPERPPPSHPAFSAEDLTAEGARDKSFGGKGLISHSAPESNSLLRQTSSSQSTPRTGTASICRPEEKSSSLLRRTPLGSLPTVYGLCKRGLLGMNEIGANEESLLGPGTQTGGMSDGFSGLDDPLGHPKSSSRCRDGPHYSADAAWGPDEKQENIGVVSSPSLPEFSSSLHGAPSPPCERITEETCALEEKRMSTRSSLVGRERIFSSCSADPLSSHHPFASYSKRKTSSSSLTRTNLYVSSSSSHTQLPSTTSSHFHHLLQLPGSGVRRRGSTEGLLGLSSYQTATGGALGYPTNKNSQMTVSSQMTPSTHPSAFCPPTPTTPHESSSLDPSAEASRNSWKGAAGSPVDPEMVPSSSTYLSLPMEEDTLSMDNDEDESTHRGPTTEEVMSSLGGGRPARIESIAVTDFAPSPLASQLMSKPQSAPSPGGVRTAFCSPIYTKCTGDDRTMHPQKAATTLLSTAMTEASPTLPMVQWGVAVLSPSTDQTTRHCSPCAAAILPTPVNSPQMPSSFTPTAAPPPPPGKETSEGGEGGGSHQKSSKEDPYDENKNSVYAIGSSVVGQSYPFSSPYGDPMEQQCPSSMVYTPLIPDSSVCYLKIIADLNLSYQELQEIAPLQYED